MKQRYHEILDDKNNFLIQAEWESLHKCHNISWKQKQKAHPENYSGSQSMQNINAFFYGETENLYHMKTFLDLKPTHNPQLFLRTVLQIWELQTQRCFNGLKTSLSYFRVEWSDRSVVWLAAVQRRERKLKPTRWEASREYVHIQYSAYVCVGFPDF